MERHLLLLPRDTLVYKSSTAVCCSPPRAKLPIREIRSLIYNRNLCFPGWLCCLCALSSLLFPPQADGGQQSDAALSDSDLEARLNSWNLGVSLWAIPGAPDLAGCREPRSRPPPILLKALAVKSYGEWENGCVNLAFEDAWSSLIARVKCTRPDSDKHSALMPLSSVIFFPISSPA